MKRKTLVTVLLVIVALAVGAVLSMFISDEQAGTNYLRNFPIRYVALEYSE